VSVVGATLRENGGTKRRIGLVVGPSPDNGNVFSGQNVDQISLPKRVKVCLGDGIFRLVLGSLHLLSCSSFLAVPWDCAESITNSVGVSGMKHIFFLQKI
jgi:hypothetical protein